VDEKDLLLADLDHFGESLWRNEEVGEIRLSFFIGVVTAVATGLVWLSRDVAGGQDLGSGELSLIGSAALAVLLVLGLLSYLRMLQRNAVSDEYKETMHEIRRRYALLCPSLAGYRVPPERKRSWRERWFRGGYAETARVRPAPRLERCAPTTGRQRRLEMHRRWRSPTRRSARASVLPS
jgi:hypothetical protein